MKSSYALGLFYIFLVSIIWSAASILVQYLYEGLDFDSPFLLTYIGTSLFIILIPGYHVYERRKDIKNFFVYIRLWPACCCDCDDDDDDGQNNNDNDEGGLEQAQTTTEGTPLSLHRDELFLEHQDEMYLDDYYIDQLQRGDMENGGVLSHLEHMRMAAKIAPWWFLSNYFYNLSLKYTTITSSTVLASTGSIFTFIFSLIWGDETFNKSKLFGVLLAFIGSFITSSHDANTSTNRFLDFEDWHGKTMSVSPFPYQLWGDIAGLISAVGYGVYTVLVRLLCHDEERISMNLFLGYVGLLNMVALSPIASWSVAKIGNDEGGPNYYDGTAGSEDAPYIAPQHLTWFVLFCLIIKGLFDNVLSDYLWAKSIILTSATVATVGLGLTIPLALVSDLFIMDRAEVWTLQSVIGAALVLAGFVFVNLGEDGKDDSRLIEALDYDDEQQEISLSENKSP